MSTGTCLLSIAHACAVLLDQQQRREHYHDAACHAMYYSCPSVKNIHLRESCQPHASVSGDTNENLLQCSMTDPPVPHLQHIPPLDAIHVLKQLTNVHAGTWQFQLETSLQAVDYSCSWSNALDCFNGHLRLLWWHSQAEGEVIPISGSQLLQPSSQTPRHIPKTISLCHSGDNSGYAINPKYSKSPLTFCLCRGGGKGGGGSSRAATPEDVTRVVVCFNPEYDAQNVVIHSVDPGLSLARAQQTIPSHNSGYAQIEAHHTGLL